MRENNKGVNNMNQIMVTINPSELKKDTIYIKTNLERLPCRFGCQECQFFTEPNILNNFCVALGKDNIIKIPSTHNVFKMPGWCPLCVGELMRPTVLKKSDFVKYKKTNIMEYSGKFISASIWPCNGRFFYILDLNNKTILNTKCDEENPQDTFEGALSRINNTIEKIFYSLGHKDEVEDQPLNVEKKQVDRLLQNNVIEASCDYHLGHTPIGKLL